MILSIIVGKHVSILDIRATAYKKKHTDSSRDNDDENYDASTKGK